MNVEQLTVPAMPVKESCGEWIVIKFKNGDLAHYKPEEYTDYYYDKVCFVVIRDKQWIGFYNIDDLSWVEIREQIG